MHSGVNFAEGDAILDGPHSQSSPPTRRRNPMACLICRRRKIKCEFNNGQEVCDHCRSKNAKCTVLSVAQEETLKSLGYSDEKLAYMLNAELESLLRHLPSQLHGSPEQIESHRFYQHYSGLPPSPHPPLQSTGQDNLYRLHDPTNRMPSPFSHNHTANRIGSTNLANVPTNTAHSAHNHHTTSRTDSTNPANMPANTPHPQAHSAYNHHAASLTGSANSANAPTNTLHPQAHSAYDHHAANRTGSTNPANVPTNTLHSQAHSAHHTASRTGSTNPAPVPINPQHPQARLPSIYTNYSTFTSPSPVHQTSYLIPATGGVSVPHHTMGDHHQLQPQLNPNVLAHSNAVQSQDHANYSGQVNYPLQAAQQPNQGQIPQYQHGGYPAAIAPDFTTRDSLSSWTRR